MFQTPQVGFEPTTNRLTADRSTPELLRKIALIDIVHVQYIICPYWQDISKIFINFEKKEFFLYFVAKLCNFW